MVEFQDLCEDITKIYKYLKDDFNDDGSVASYIPQLASVDPDLFGISVVGINGETFNIGDYDVPFSIQSCSKPIMYAIARDILPASTVHKHVGYEPSGVAFNAFALNDEKPHNPLINSGAIMIASLIYPDREPAERFNALSSYLRRLSGKKRIHFNNSVYLSEKTHASRNRALSYYMLEHNAFPKAVDIDATLDFYFQACSISEDCSTLASIAATFANNGINPITNTAIFDVNIVRDTLSLMFTCGMYDYSGRFAFHIGLAAKSGVAGAIFVIIPNIAGICIFSPKLDQYGNSVKGLKFCHELIKIHSDFHMFNNLIRQQSLNKHVNDDYLSSDIVLVAILLKAASLGDVDRIRKVAKELDVNTCDYDKRSALHIACADGHLEVVKLLLQLGAKVDIKDRWGTTCIDEAKRNLKKDEQLYQEILDLLLHKPKNEIFTPTKIQPMKNIKKKKQKIMLKLKKKVTIKPKKVIL